MCGRYVAISKVKAVEKRFSALVERPELFTPNTNIDKNVGKFSIT